MDQHPDRSALREAMPIFYALLLAIFTVALVFLLIRLEHVLLILFISLLFAATLAQPAEALTRFKIPRGLAVIIIYLAAFGFIGLLGWLVLPPVLTELAEFGGNLPEYAEEVEAARQAYDSLRERYPGLASFDAQITRISSSITTSVSSTLLGLPTTLIRVAFDALSIFFISIMLVTSRERILNLTLSVIHPNQRDIWERVLTKMWDRLGRYLRAKLIVMTICGILMYIALIILGVQFPLLLAIIVAFGETIPRIGVWFARVPLFGIAALDGIDKVIQVYIASIIIENAKGYVISPWVEGGQLDIHPLLVFVSVLVGGTLLGVAGAFVAVPAAAMIQVVFEEVILPWRAGQFTSRWQPDEPVS